jgi:hypothetical protein
MTPSSFCQKCGTQLNPDSRFCPACGESLDGSSPASVSSVTVASEPPRSEKSALTAFILCLFFGSLGVHRFYVGKVGTGILMLLTAGGLGLWYLYDLISIVCNNFSDSQGKILVLSRNTSAAKKVLIVVGALFAGFGVLIASVFLLLFMVLGNLADVAQDQLAAFRSGDLTKAYSYTSTDFRTATSFEDFKQFYQTHPILKTNESASFPSRQFNNDEGTLTGSLKLKDGSAVPIDVMLKKEKGEWKIQGMDFSPADAAKDAPASDLTSTTVNDKTNLLTSKAQKFAINYPVEWIYVQTDPHSIDFGWKDAHPNKMVVNMQVIPSKKIGGIYATTQDVVTDLKKQINDTTKDATFDGAGEITLPQSAEKIHGEYFEVSYTYNGGALKKIQYVFLNESGDYFYTLGYTAEPANFESDLPYAKAMLESFVIQ